MTCFFPSFFSPPFSLYYCIVFLYCSFLIHLSFDVLFILGISALSLFAIAIMFSWRIVDCAFPFISSDKYAANKLEENRQNRLQVNIGPCIWVFSGKCPNPDIQFYLFTRKNARDRQSIRVDETWQKSNLSDSFFNPNHPTKVIVHGYNSDMFLTPLIQMKEGT